LRRRRGWRRHSLPSFSGEPEEIKAYPALIDAYEGREDARNVQQTRAIDI
jgi:hypothetical protein